MITERHVQLLLHQLDRIATALEAGLAADEQRYQEQKRAAEEMHDAISKQLDADDLADDSDLEFWQKGGE